MVKCLLTVIGLVCFYAVHAQQLTIHYPTNKYQLTAADTKAIDSLLLSSGAVTEILLTGHTDNTGSAEYNQQLSIKRVDQVYRYLQSKQIDTAIIGRQYFGSTQPAVPNSTPANRTQNRRTEITLVVNTPAKRQYPIGTMRVEKPSGHPTMTVKKLQEGVDLVLGDRGFIGDQTILPDPPPCGRDFVAILDNLVLLNAYKITSLTMDNQVLVSQLVFNPCLPRYTIEDSSVVIKLLIRKPFLGDTASLKVYEAVTLKDGSKKWRLFDVPYKIEITDTAKYFVIPYRNYSTLLNFAYPLKARCFNAEDKVLKLKGYKADSLVAIDSVVNCAYPVIKKGKNTYTLLIRNGNPKNMVLWVRLKPDTKKIEGAQLAMEVPLTSLKRKGLGGILKIRSKRFAFDYVWKKHRKRLIRK